MKNIFHSLLGEQGKDRPLALASILATKGSAPQVPGATALFSSKGLLSGTLGGGILEGDATNRAHNLMGKGSSFLYDFGLDADIDSEEGAICGGTATLLIDASPERSKDVFNDIDHSVRNNESGVLATVITGQKKVEIERFWLRESIHQGEQIPDRLKKYSNEIASCLEKKNCLYFKESDSISIFLQPVFPLSKLIIVGAGHIGKALANLAGQLDFEVTVIDDRPEYANKQNIPFANNILVDSIGKAVREVPKTNDTYIVIVTRGHRDDADALKACIHSNVPYIGMIGSKKKINLMRENFISKGWATGLQFDRIHAPIGLEIGSKTVQEIAVSISAQLVQVRSRKKYRKKDDLCTAVILAAGESRRMGKPKMLLPFGNTSIIEKVIGSANHSLIDKTVVVLGSDNEAISNLIQDYPVEIVYNELYKNGMLSSVQAGLQTIDDRPKAVMVLLGDQPMIGSAIINKMIETYQNSEKEIIVASYHGKRGHPILFGRKYVDEIMKFSKENSLKDLLQKYPGDIEEMNTTSSEILRDIDTEKDYQEELKNQSYYD